MTAVSLSSVRPNPRLEVLRCLPAIGGGRDTPLLFIHGAYVAAWCWQEHFLPFFARHGYAAYAVSLRGHGASEGRERLFGVRLREYVQDIEGVIGQLGATPILVGHSMGGMVVQKYLERRTAPAAVLMASAPPQGLWYAVLWMALTNPLLLYEINLMALGGPQLVTVDSARRAIFAGDIADGKVRSYMRRTQPESQWAIMDMSWLDLPRPNRRLQPPMLVLGGADDALIPVAAVHSTARAFGTRAEIFPQIGHAMMLDAAWQRVAERILVWLRLAGF